MIKENNNHIQWITVKDASEQTKTQVKGALSDAPRVIRNYTGHLAESQGKFIRATALLTCAMNEEELVHPNAAKLAAAVELLHLATLVHDDIIDDAPTRRGQNTLQKQFGKKTAVICGDYLFCMALKLAASTSNHEDYLGLSLPNYMSKICLGELSQHLHNHDFDLSTKGYFKIISGKTAALFEAAFYAGAVLCGHHSTQGAKYRRLGKYVGMIFQLTDDCMDYETTENMAKKPVRSDYEQGVITLPLIYALRRMGELKGQCKSGALSKEELYRAVVQAGGTGFTHEVSKRYYEKARAVLDDLKVIPQKKAALSEVLDQAFFRK